MKSIYILFLSCLFAISAGATTTPAANTPARGHKTLTGKISDAKDGEALIGVSVYLPQLKRGTVTDIEGNYILKDLPAITTSVQVTYVGHQSVVKDVDLRQTSQMDLKLQESNAQINEVVVTGFTGNLLLRQMPAAVSYISSKDLVRQSSTNIIDAVAKQPGIAQVTTGPGISKPVIRGLGYNRVVVVNDGIRQEGQQWGDEHGIEIDDQSVGSVEVIKGPASLMYGSDAMAGVIDFKREPSLPEGKIQSNVFAEYQSNNGLLHESVNNAGNIKNIVWDVRYSNKWAHAYRNKYDGYVYGSAFQEHALSGVVGVNRNWGYSHVNFSIYHLRPGIVEGGRDEKTGLFTKPVNQGGQEGEAIATDSDGKSYGRPFPYQQVRHYKVVSDNDFLIGDGNLRAIVGYQQNRRQEFEDVTNPDQYGLYFQLHTVNYDFRYTFPEIAHYKIVAGVNGMYQHSLNKGTEFLIPEYNLFDAGIFAIANRQAGKFNINGGLRLDTRYTHGHSLVAADGDSGSDKPFERFKDFKRRFNGVSGSLGATYHVSDALDLKLNVSRGFRAPNISELASNGAHEGTLRYEIGNTSLKPENSWQGDLGLTFSSKIISVDLALFANRINNFVFAHKLTDSQGTAIIKDGKTSYEYASGDARLWGGEFSVDLHPVERLHFQNTFSYVNSTQLNQPDSTKYLPFTPAPKFTSDIRFDIIRHGKVLNNTYASFGLESYLTQNHFYSAYGTETATPSYTLLNASLGTDIMHRGRRVASVFLIGENLTDKAYQSHLSRLKYGDVNNVTGREGVFNEGRNIGIKVQIPIDL